MQIRLRFSFACTCEFVVAFGALLLQERFVKRVPARQLFLFEQCPELPEVQVTDVNDLRWLRGVGLGSAHLRTTTAGEHARRIRRARAIGYNDRNSAYSLLLRHGAFCRANTRFDLIRSAMYFTIVESAARRRGKQNNTQLYSMIYASCLLIILQDIAPKPAYNHSRSPRSSIDIASYGIVEILICHVWLLVTRATNASLEAEYSDDSRSSRQRATRSVLDESSHEGGSRLQLPNFIGACFAIVQARNWGFCWHDDAKRTLNNERRH